VDPSTPREPLPTALAALKGATAAKARLVVGDELQPHGLELAAKLDLQLGSDCEAEAAADFILHMGWAQAAAAANRLGGMVWHANTSFPATCLLGIVETGLGTDAGRAHQLLQAVVVRSAAVQVTLTGGGGDDGDASLETWHGQPLRRGAQVHVTEATLGVGSAARNLFVALVGRKVSATLSSRLSRKTANRHPSSESASVKILAFGASYRIGNLDGLRMGLRDRCRGTQRRQWAMRTGLSPPTTPPWRLS
jgi:hypothetical protein